MDVKQLIENLLNNIGKKNSDIFLKNVFSQITKSEKNKQYLQLQSDLLSLKKSVKMMEDYNRDKMGNKSKKPKRFSIDKYRHIPKRMSTFSNRKILNLRNKSKDKDNINRSLDLNQGGSKLYNRLSVYKTEVDDNENDSKTKNLPNIFNLKDISIGNKSSRKNKNKKTEKILPLLNNRYKLTQRQVNQINKNNILTSQNLNKAPISKKFPKLPSQKRLNSSWTNKERLIQDTEKILRNMKEHNRIIKNKINYKLAEQNLVDWEMKSKLKWAKWKFGIEEINKYFVDLNAYGKPEEEELLKRKTFYEVVEDLIDEIKQKKDEKEIKAIEDKYFNKKQENKFGDVKKEDKNEDANGFDLVDKAINKNKELSQVLKFLKLRKIQEKRKRVMVDNILMKCEMRRKVINNMTKRNEMLQNLSNEKKSEKIDKKKQK